MIGQVHNLCEPGFFGDPELFEFDRWFLSTFVLLVAFVISSVFAGWFLSVFGQLVIFWCFQFRLWLFFPHSQFAAWVAFVGL